MQKFVLLADRRTGTTLMIDLLNSHPRVRCIKRAFGLEERVENPTPDRHSGMWYLYRTASWRRRLDFLVRRRGLIEAFLTEEVFRPRDGRDVIGFRLIYPMAGRYPQILAWVRDEGVAVIHLVRENLLKTHLSKVTAPLHKMHHPREGERIRTVRIRVDPAEVRHALDRQAAMLDRMRAAIAPVPSLEVAYEALVADRNAVAERLLGFLGVENGFPLQSDLVKINPDSVRDIVENHEELAAALAGTPHERFLD